MIAVVSGEVLRARLEWAYANPLKEALALGHVSQLTFAPSVTELLEQSRHHHNFLVIDAEAYMQEATRRPEYGRDTREAVLAAYRALHPHVRVVLVYKDSELVTDGMCRTIIAVSPDTTVSLSATRTLDFWFKLARESKAQGAVNAFLSDFDTECRAQKCIPGELYVRYIMEHAMQNPSVCEIAKGCTDENGPLTDDKLIRILKRQGQFPPKSLLLIFRLLWYTRLRHEGWQPHKIAKLLSFDSVKIMNQSLQRVYGVTVAEIAALPYERAMRWAMNLISHPRPGKRPPMKQLLQELVKVK